MPRTLVFAQQKGGAGKTTLLVQLAHAFAARGRAVRLLDLDPQGTLARWAAIRDDPRLPCTAAPDWQASSALRRAAEGAELLLVDLPGSADILQRAALRAASLVLVPAQPTPPDAWATAPTLAAAAKERAPARVVLNRVPARGASPAALAALGDAALLSATLGARVAFADAFAEGRAAAELAPRSRAAAEVRALADEVGGLLR